MKRICIIASLALVTLCAAANPLAQKSYTKKIAGTEQSPRVSRPLHSTTVSRLKSGTEPTHRLDSIEYVDYTMWNLHYNELNQLDSEICKELDEETGKYFDRDKATYTYNAKGDWTEKIGYILNAGNWIPDYRYVWQFDDNGLMITEMYSDWDADAKVWENNDRTTFGYNASKLLVEEIEEYKNDAGWYIHDKRVYTYNAAGQQLREYIYQGSDALTDSLVFDYSVANKVIVLQYADFMSNDDNLAKSDSTIYTFDANGNELAQTHYIFKNSSMKFELDNEFTTTYDLSVRAQQAIMPPLYYFEYAYSDSIVNMPMKEVYGEMDSESGEWVEYDDVVYHYSKIGTVTAERPVDTDTVAVAPLIIPVYTQRLDSVVSIFSKTIYHYNSSGYNNVMEIYSLDDSEKLVKTEEHAYSYNQYGQIAEDLWKTYKGGVVTDDELIKYYYDAQGNPIKMNFFNKDPETGDWIYYEKIVNTFNSDNKIVESVINLFDEDNNWYVEEKQTYTYDVLGRIINNSDYGFGNDLYEYSTFEYTDANSSYIQLNHTTSRVNNKIVVTLDDEGNTSSIYSYSYDIDNNETSDGYCQMHYNTNISSSTILNGDISEPNRLDKQDLYGYDESNNPEYFASTDYYYSKIGAANTDRPVDTDTVAVAPLIIPVYTQRLDSIVSASDKTIIHYNSSDYNNALVELYYLDVSDNLIKSDELAFTYNKYGQLVEEHDKQFVPFVDEMLIKYYYDAQGNQVKLNFFYRDAETDEWFYSSNHLYIYNSNNKETDFSINVWGDDNTWQIEENTVKTYDLNGRLIKSSDFYFGTDPTTYTTYEYAESGTSYTEKLVYPDGDYDRSVVTLDNKGNTSTIFRYSYENSVEKLISEEVYYYNTNISSSNIFNGEISKPSRIDKMEKYVYDNSNKRVLDETTNYYYSDFKKTSATNNLAETVVLYPNPASQYIKLNTAGTLEICIAGRSVFAGSVASGESINVSAWPQGMYLYQIRTAEGTASGTFVKE